MEPGKMTRIVDIGAMSYEAQAALVFYRLSDPTKETEDLDRRDTIPPSYVTAHSVRDNQVSEGTPISRKRLLKLFSSVVPSLKEDRVEILPPQVIAYSRYDHILWWATASVMSLFFKKGVGIPSGKAPVPPLLFFYRGKVLDIYAMKEDTRPTEETTLYFTPFFNGGCMGNVRLPELSSASVTKTMEDSFFRSEFTADNPPRLKGVEGQALWKSLIKEKRREFPYECLEEAGTLKSILGGRVYG